MADTVNSPHFDSRLAEGVENFEQMLELMPDDREALEFLLVAYCQLGDKVKEGKTLVSLANLLIKERDIESLKGLVPRLEASSEPAARALALKAGILFAPVPDLVPEAPRELTEAEKTAQLSAKAVKSELKLLDILIEGGRVETETAATVRAQLEADENSERGFLISALQILEKENPTLSEKALAFLADRFKTPPVPLAAFDARKDLFAHVPAAVARVRGVAPFATVAKTLLVAVANPADEELARELETAAGMKIRRYLAPVAEIEAAAAKALGAEAR